MTRDLEPAPSGRGVTTTREAEVRDWRAAMTYHSENQGCRPVRNIDPYPGSASCGDPLGGEIVEAEEAPADGPFYLRSGDLRTSEKFLPLPNFTLSYSYETRPILLCRGLKSNLQVLWPKLKIWEQRDTGLQVSVDFRNRRFRGRGPKQCGAYVLVCQIRIWLSVRLLGAKKEGSPGRAAHSPANGVQAWATAVVAPFRLKPCSACLMIHRRTVWLL